MKPPPMPARSAEAVRTGSGPLRHLVGVDHGGFGRFDRGGRMKVTARVGCAGKQREGDFSEHRRTLHCFVVDALGESAAVTRH